MYQNANGKAPPVDPADVADKLHSAAIHLLRRVARRDTESGLSAARLSLLSILVFGGPSTVGELAHAERVSLPTISRMVAGMEHDGLVTRETASSDRRVVRVRATEEGIQILQQARLRRVHDLANQVQNLSAEEIETLQRATDILQRLQMDWAADSGIGGDQGALGAG